MEDSPKGFPIVASYLDSDDSFMMYRRFGFLHARLLLNKQDELRELEEELRELDDLDWEDESCRRYLQSREKDEGRDLEDGRVFRPELLEKIEKKILEYGAYDCFPEFRKRRRQINPSQGPYCSKHSSWWL